MGPGGIFSGVIKVGYNFNKSNVVDNLKNLYGLYDPNVNEESHYGFDSQIR